MTKHKKYIVTFILPGNIIQDLHFGSFSRNWWLSRPDDHSTFRNNEFKPGYICQLDGIYSKIYENSTIAITSVYQHIFSVATKYTSPLIIGIGKSNNPEWNYVQVYQATQEVAMFKNTSPNTAIKEIPSCTSLDWNNEIFEKVFQYHLKRRLSPNINWCKFFISWSKQSHIIELHQKLKEIYSKEQVIKEREW
ncbi:hypothetical protein C2G38_2232482 [Gigaspora rosea]|uniref:Uncharacterized protein n=1 Tax=Gigaspora rosea TaxID=44941 RepID=A0A397TX03_9GLOM|nr:hypothetical protein C2G38_2232482 [Gigaspora rosea]